MLIKIKIFKLFIIAALLIISHSSFARNYEVLNKSHYINLINYSKEYQNCTIENTYKLENGQISKVTFKVEYTDKNLVSYTVSATLYNNNLNRVSQSRFLFDDRKKSYNFKSPKLFLYETQDSFQTPSLEKTLMNPEKYTYSHYYMLELIQAYIKSMLNDIPSVPLEEKGPLSISYIADNNIVTHDIETDIDKQLEIMNGCFNPVVEHGLKMAKEKAKQR